MAQETPHFSIDPSINWRPLLKIGIGIRSIILFLSLCYLAWELFWARRVGYAFIKWHTHLMIYFYLWLSGYYLIRMLLKKRRPGAYVKASVLYTAVVATLFAAEALLLLAGVKQTGLERTMQGYISTYGSPNESWYHTWAPGKTHWLEKQEYRYIRQANTLGFSDMEWPVAKKIGEKRILALGDSFTEGDGAPYDSSYVALLRAILLSEDSSFYVMNAGTSGSDPFNNFINYRDRLASYQPDVIIQTLSSGDLNTDIIIRGGMERFRPDGKVCYKKAPFWEPIYAVSNLSRLAFSAMGYNELLMKANAVSEQKRQLDSLTVGLFKQYAARAQANNCRLLIILQPFRDEVDQGRYQYDLSAIRDALTNTGNIEIYDLLPFYTAYGRDHHRSIHDYYWPKDGHHNSAGYRMMAEGISGLIRTQK